VQQNSSSITCALNEQQRIGTYGGLTAGLVFLNFLRGALLYFICINASRVLHNRLFSSVLRVPILFFDNNPSGKLLLYNHIHVPFSVSTWLDCIFHIM
jgi:ATP-binding cassette subfamily C (CFTR/MRP) protein 4